MRIKKRTASKPTNKFSPKKGLKNNSSHKQTARILMVKAAPFNLRIISQQIVKKKGTKL